MSETFSTIDFDKSADGLVPVIIQDLHTDKVLMLGYMNTEALEKTKKEGTVTFFSRSKQRLWTKGETSGNFLFVNEITADCDKKICSIVDLFNHEKSNLPASFITVSASNVFTLKD